MEVSVLRRVVRLLWLVIGGTRWSAIFWLGTAAGSRGIEVAVMRHGIVSTRFASTAQQTVTGLGEDTERYPK